MPDSHRPLTSPDRHVILIDEDSCLTVYTFYQGGWRYGSFWGDRD